MMRPAISIDELWEGEATGVIVDGQKVLLLKFGDEVFAYENRCLHMGAALSDGFLEGETLTCPLHAWQYDARTGKGINPTDVCLKSFRVSIENGTVFVDVGGRKT